MSLLILTSKSLKTLNDTDQLKCLPGYDTQLLVTDLALHNLQAEAGFDAVKDFIDRGFITVIDTILIEKIDQYKESSLNPEECSIRNVIDIYAEKEEAVIILVDEDWGEMQIDNIQITSTSKFLNSNQLMNSDKSTANQLSADDYRKSVRQAAFLESVKDLPVDEAVNKAKLFPDFKKSEFKIIHSGEDHYRNKKRTNNVYLYRHRIHHFNGKNTKY